MAQGIKKVYVVKDDNAKGTSFHTAIRQRGLDKEQAERKDNFIIAEVGGNAYIVVDGNRYYLNWKNSILAHGTAIIDIDELSNEKAYPFDDKFKTDDMLIVKSFEELREAAIEQFEKRGHLPQIAVTREWDPENNVDGYTINAMAN
jgi:hypothetical protein